MENLNVNSQDGLTNSVRRGSQVDEDKEGPEIVEKRGARPCSESSPR